MAGRWGFIPLPSGCGPRRSTFGQSAFSGVISFVEVGVKSAVVRFFNAIRSRLSSEHSRKEDRTGDHRRCRGLRDLFACTIRPTLASLGSNLYESRYRKDPFWDAFAPRLRNGTICLNKPAQICLREKLV